MDEFEVEYYNATKKYLEMLDTMVEVSNTDTETTDLERAGLLLHRDFTRAVLESF